MGAGAFCRRFPSAKAASPDCSSRSGHLPRLDCLGGVQPPTPKTLPGSNHLRGVRTARRSARRGGPPGKGRRGSALTMPRIPLRRRRFIQAPTEPAGEGGNFAPGCNAEPVEPWNEIYEDIRGPFGCPAEAWERGSQPPLVQCRVSAVVDRRAYAAAVDHESAGHVPGERRRLGPADNNHSPGQRNAWRRVAKRRPDGLGLLARSLRDGRIPSHLSRHRRRGRPVTPPRATERRSSPGHFSTRRRVCTTAP